MRYRHCKRGEVARIAARPWSPPVTRPQTDPSAVLSASAHTVWTTRRRTRRTPAARARLIGPFVDGGDMPRPPLSFQLRSRHEHRLIHHDRCTERRGAGCSPLRGGPSSLLPSSKKNFSPELYPKVFFFSCVLRKSPYSQTFGSPEWLRTALRQTTGQGTRVCSGDGIISL